MPRAYKFNHGKPKCGQRNRGQSQHKSTCKGEKNVPVFPIKAFSALNQTSVHPTAPFNQHHNNHEGKKMCEYKVQKLNDKKQTQNEEQSLLITLIG